MHKTGLAFASCLIGGMAFAAWTSNPAIKASVDLGAWNDSDPHFINLSEDGRYLSAGLASSDAGMPFEVLSVAGLAASHGDVGDTSLKAYSSAAGCKGGAVSEKWGVFVVGRGVAGEQNYKMSTKKTGMEKEHSPFGFPIRKKVHAWFVCDAGISPARVARCWFGVGVGC